MGAEAAATLWVRSLDSMTTKEERVLLRPTVAARRVEVEVDGCSCQSPPSDRLPQLSWGNVWDATWPALRTYQTVARTRKQGAQAGHLKYMVLVQLDTLDHDSTSVLENVYGKQGSCKVTTKFKIAPALMQFQEHGSLPEGIMVFEFDEKPTLADEKELNGISIVRQDAWELFVEKGDSTLEL